VLFGDVLFRGRIMAVTGGYIGDAPPYQGHVSILDAATGAIQATWNSLWQRPARAPRSRGLSPGAVRHLVTRRRRDRSGDGQHLHHDRQRPLGWTHRVGRFAD
jgi:hypothetical protein